MKSLFLLITPFLATSNDYWETSTRALSSISQNIITDENQADLIIHNYLNFAKECGLNEKTFLKTLDICVDEKIKSLESNITNNNNQIQHCKKFRIGSIIGSAAIVWYTLKKLEKNPYFDLVGMNISLALLGATLTFYASVETKCAKNELKLNKVEFAKFSLAKKVIQQLNL